MGLFSRWLLRICWACGGRLRVVVFDVALVFFVAGHETGLVWPTYNLLHVMHESE